MELKDQIKIHRMAKGLSKKEFAEMLNPPVSEQSVTWWEEGEHRPKMSRISDINRVLGVVLDVSEQGDAVPMGNAIPVRRLDPEVVSLAVSIWQLPKAVMESLQTMVDYVVSTTIVKKSKPFTEEEFITKRSTNFTIEEKGVVPNGTNAETKTRRTSAKK